MKAPGRIAEVVWYCFTFVYVLPMVLLWPVAILFDQRRYIIPSEILGTKAGLWRYYCISHYALKETARCPNCGILKRELVKVTLPRASDQQHKEGKQ